MVNFSTPTPTEDELDLQFISPFDLANPSYLDFTRGGVFAVMDDYSNALPYSKVNSISEATSGTGQILEFGNFVIVVQLIVVLISL